MRAAAAPVRRAAQSKGCVMEVIIDTADINEIKELDSLLNVAGVTTNPKINALRPENTYAKIPVSPAGLKACKDAKAEGLNVLSTSVYSSEQGFLAAVNGADYIAPYTNRMSNYGDGIQQVKDLIEMLRVQGLSSKVMAASLHNTSQVHELIKAGIQAITFPPAILHAMIDHPGTQIAVDEFSASWEKAYGRNELGL